MYKSCATCTMVHVHTLPGFSIVLYGKLVLKTFCWKDSNSSGAGHSCIRRVLVVPLPCSHHRCFSRTSADSSHKITPAKFQWRLEQGWVFVTQAWELGRVVLAFLMQCISFDLVLSCLSWQILADPLWCPNHSLCGSLAFFCRSSILCNSHCSPQQVRLHSSVV
jgi:hypothetical protein